MELLVGMTITALLVIFSMNGIRLLQAYQLQSKNVNELLWQEQQLKMLLKREAMYAEWMELSSGHLYFSFRDSTDSQYFFEEDYCFRKRGVYVDTFSFSIQLTDPTFEGDYVEEGIIDKCKIEYQSTTGEGHFKLEKLYSAEQLMRQDSDIR